MEVKILLRWGTNIYTPRNQVHILSTVRCIGGSEVTLTGHLAHLFIIAWV